MSYRSIGHQDLQLSQQHTLLVRNEGQGMIADMLLCRSLNTTTGNADAFLTTTNVSTQEQLHVASGLNHASWPVQRCRNFREEDLLQ